MSVTREIVLLFLFYMDFFYTGWFFICFSLKFLCDVGNGKILTKKGKFDLKLPIFSGIYLYFHLFVSLFTAVFLHPHKFKIFVMLQWRLW